VAAVDVEILCSDAAEHRRRVESRKLDSAASDVTASIRAIVNHLSGQACRA
jgi:hypothetical protein